MITSEYPEYDRYFLDISTAIVEFADRHNLLLEKYPKEGPTWSLCFNHPLGGQVMVNVNRLNEKCVELFSRWWLDDYKTHSRSIKSIGPSVVEKNPKLLQQNFTATLQEILNWKIGEWDTVDKSDQRYWDEFTEEEFYAMAPQWPLPKV